MTGPRESARRRACGRYGSSGFATAYVNGAYAALAGRPADFCPYPLDPSGRTWRARYRSAWLAGWASASTR